MGPRGSAVSDVTVQVGDVIHVSLEDVAAKSPLLELPQKVAPPSVDQLLATSRVAHSQFYVHSGSIERDGSLKTAPNDPSAAQAIQAALDARLAADAADPTHADPAWATDLQANRGVTSDVLIEFYRTYLAD